jgi:formylglycine-generating enzyme required for sulfatase activity
LEETRDPTGADLAVSRVVRGGSFGYAAVNLRTANRNGSGPRGRLSNLGFRAALPFPPVDP